MMSDSIWIEYEGLKFLLLNDSDFTKVSLIKESDAVIVNNTNEVLTEFLLEQIRRDEDENVYLKPIFLSSKFHNLSSALKNLVDFEITNIDSSLPELKNIVLRINGKLNKLNPVKTFDFDSFVINKLLRFSYTRDLTSLKPVLDRKSKLGYSFPFLTYHFNTSEAKSVLDVLQTAEDEGYMTGEHQETVHLCNQCHNIFLIYREVCPKCSSSDLAQEDIIHHFPCAYIGPMTDFTRKNKSELHCPKCDKQLKHIGVDYDKPSAVNTCKSCEHIFQDIQIKAKCGDCHKDSDVELLLQRKIKNYNLTQKGLFAAQNGIDATHNNLSQISGTVNIETFKTMLQYEIERMKVAHIDNNLGCIHIGDNAKDLFFKIGSDSKQQLLSDLVQIIRNSIRTSDIIAFENSTTMLFSLTESKHEDAVRTVRKISIMIRKLVKENFGGFHLNLQYKVLPINRELSYVEQLKELTLQTEKV